MMATMGSALKTPVATLAVVEPAIVPAKVTAKRAKPARTKLASLSPADADRLVRVFLEGRSERTREAYTQDLSDFATFVKQPTQAAAAAHLLAAGHGGANALVLEYRAHLQRRKPQRNGGAEVGEKLAAATINRRLAALRSCVQIARLLGLVSWAIDVPNLRVEPYRDTRGPGREGTARLLAMAERSRDRAIVRLLYDLALRRIEVHRLDLSDVDFEGKRIRVRGKGKTSKKWLSLPGETSGAIEEWLEARGDKRGALFIALDRGHHGHRLSGTSIYRVVVALGDRANVRARPHGLRHAAITEALERTKGDVRRVARFSRHADVRTVQRYDDDRRDLGGEVAALVAKGLEGGSEPAAAGTDVSGPIES